MQVKIGNGSTECTTDVHMGKEHSDNLECGLCAFKLKDKEQLETHQLTCEIYKCTLCDNNFVKLADLKDDVTTDHEYNKYRSIIHAKQNRFNEEEIDETYYRGEELFPDL